MLSSGTSLSIGGMGRELNNAGRSIGNFAILRTGWNKVPETRVVLYREEGGLCPFVESFNELPAKVQDGIYELRISLGGVHHRILYFFSRGNRGGGLARPCESAGGPAEAHLRGGLKWQRP